MKKIAFVIPQFGKEFLGGSEKYAELMAYHNKHKFEITILTTKSNDHATWSNSADLNSDFQDGMRVLRFPVDHPRNVAFFNQLTNELLQNKNDAKEQKWIKNYGPYSTKLLEFLANNRSNYDIFIFFGYNHSLTYFGLPIVNKKAILIPFAHLEPTLQFKLYEKVFSSPLAIAAGTNAEIAIIKDRFSNLPPIHKLGIGSILSPIYKKNLNIFPNIKKPYVLYIGRIEKNKGIFDLCSYFAEYKKRYANNLTLAIVGKQYDPVPKGKYFNYLGIVGDQEKQYLIKNCELLINPSFYESLSLTLFEAWQQSKPVLVNGLSEVLRAQVMEADGGLFYKNENEFSIMLDWLINHPKEKNVFGKQGKSYLKQNYFWKDVKAKFESLINTYSRK
jgi:glycosyltransferase involved in cell wall biosynthesis